LIHFLSAKIKISIETIEEVYQYKKIKNLKNGYFKIFDYSGRLRDQQIKAGLKAAFHLQRKHDG